jgi:hypothetical protein
LLVIAEGGDVMLSPWFHNITRGRSIPFILLLALYFALAIAQAAAFFQGMELWFGIGWILSLVIGIIVLGLPFGSSVCTAVAFYGAYKGWQWEWWQAALLTFPFAILGVAVMGASGAVGIANRARAEARAPNAPRQSIEPVARSSWGWKRTRYDTAFSQLLLPLVAVLACFVTAWAATPLGGRATSVFRIDYNVYERTRDFLAGRPRAAPIVPMQDVLVAFADLRPTQVLNNENMRWQPWPENALNPVYITRSARPDAMETLAGSVVDNRMSFGEPIREANLARTPADVNALMQRLGTKESSRGFVERYMAAPSEKALAREKGGTYLVETHGWRTIEEARQAALATCQRTRPACDIVMENNRWLAPAM